MNKSFLGNKKTLLVGLIFFVFFISSWLFSLVVGFYSAYFLFIFLFISFNRKVDKGKELKINKLYLIIPVLIFIIARIVPFYLHGSHPLGYDTGFYNYNIEKDRAEIQEGVYFGFEDEKFSLGKIESLGAKLVNKTLILSGLSNEAILYWFYIFIGLSSGVLMYFLLKRTFGDEAALFSVFLYALSFTQYLAYWFMLWKNALGVLIILVLIYLSLKENRKNYFLSLFLFLFLIITHKTSAILMLLAYFVYLVFFKKMDKKLWFAFSFIAIFFIFLYRDLLMYFYDQLMSNFTKYYDVAKVKEGVFIDIGEYLNYAILYIPFSLVGIYYSFKERRGGLILSFFLVSFLFVATKFIFYKRIIIFLDLSFILFFGYGFSLFLKKLQIYIQNWHFEVLRVLVFSFSVFLYFSSVIQVKPVLSDDKINVIISANGKYDDLKIFTNNPEYNSWLYGFSGHKVISPGWEENDWGLAKWEEYWNGDSDEKHKLLRGFRQSLLIYSPEGEDLPKVLPDFYLFEYNN